MLYLEKIEWLHKGWNHFDHPEYQLQTGDTLCHFTRSRAAAFTVKTKGSSRDLSYSSSIHLCLNLCHHSTPIHTPQIYPSTGCWEEVKIHLFFFISQPVLMLQFFCCMGRGEVVPYVLHTLNFLNPELYGKRISNPMFSKDLSCLRLILFELYECL